MKLKIKTFFSWFIGIVGILALLTMAGVYFCLNRTDRAYRDILPGSSRSTIKKQLSEFAETPASLFEIEAGGFPLWQLPLDQPVKIYRYTYRFSPFQWFSFHLIYDANDDLLLAVSGYE